MHQFEEFTYESSTGVNQIHALRCKPEGEVRAVVQIAHGISEHIGRYRNFMAYLAEQGFVVAGNDHLGHGRSAVREEEKGVFCPQDGWNHAVQDMVQLHEQMSRDYPGKKYILLGHSMGSFLTRTYLADYPDKYDMAILSGTGHQNKMLIGFGNMIADGIIRKNGYVSDGTALCKLTMGNYLKKIDSPKTPFDWLSCDDEMNRIYMEDPLCGFTASTGMYADMLKGIRYVTDMKNITRMNREKPVLFVSGREDPVGDYGKGVERAYACFKKAGLKDVTMKLYKDGRHEMLNEVNRDEVYAYILAWISERI